MIAIKSKEASTVQQESSVEEKFFANYLLCHSSQENFCDLGKLIYKNSDWDKKCKKTFANASRFAKFTNFFFCRQFPLYGS